MNQETKYPRFDRTVVKLGEGNIAIGAWTYEVSRIPFISFSTILEGERNIGSPVHPDDYEEFETSVRIEITSLESLAVLQGAVDSVKKTLLKQRKAKTDSDAIQKSGQKLLDSLEKIKHP